jgi:hypothetical protein
LRIAYSYRTRTIPDNANILLIPKQFPKQQFGCG